MAGLAFVVIIVAALIFARKSRPGGNKVGNSIIALPPLETEPAQLKVATYNIQTGKNLQGHRNLKASADVIKNANLVCIQEIYAPSLSNLAGFGLSQIEELALSLIHI